MIFHKISLGLNPGFFLKIRTGFCSISTFSRSGINFCVYILFSKVYYHIYAKSHSQGLIGSELMIGGKPFAFPTYLFNVNKAQVC